jgi:nicotinic acid mononucleotide adenylyltransferase
MDPTLRCLIEAIHRSARKCVLALTGGGLSAAAQLLSVPGGSRTILEVVLPYDAQSLADFLGHRPAQACSAQTSRAMAHRAHTRAGWLATGEAVVGLGCTASLATDRPKRGDHRFFVSIETEDRCLTHSLTLRKGARDRVAEEAVVATVLLNALAEAAGLPEQAALPLLPEETVQTESAPQGGPLAALLRGELAAVCSAGDGQLRTNSPRPAVLLPGAFNPVHQGHWQLAAAAARLVGTPPAFELSVLNVDKAPLFAAEVRQRLGQFAWRVPVWVTRAPTFAEKASLFPAALFVIGADTAMRLVAPRYYQNSEARLAEALQHLRRQGCRFLVAGREDSSGRFIRYEDLPMLKGHEDLFQGIPEQEFRVPVSSTQIREQAQRVGSEVSTSGEE